MKGLLAVLVVGLIGGGIAAVVVRKEAPENKIVHTATTRPPVTETVIVPPAGQTLVSGTVQSFSADGADAGPIPTPFTINAVERGAVRNATAEAAIIDGQRKTIYWYAGQPLPVSGSGGALDLGPAHVDADVHGVTWSLTATDGVIIHFDAPALKVDGPGTLHMTGTFTLRTASGTKTATTLTMASGPFQVTLRPAAGGVAVTATLQGAVTSK